MVEENENVIITDENQLLTVEQVRDRLKLKQANTVYNYISNGKLKAYKLTDSNAKNSRIRVKEKDLQDFILSNPIANKKKYKNTKDKKKINAE